MNTLTSKDLSLIISTQQEIAMAALEVGPLMQLVCERSQELTGAIGAVVEMLEGDEMVYKAVSGSASSSLGFRLKAETSLSGLCFRSREQLCCDDSETDRRVDREACRRIQVRSMILVPLMQKDSAIGVLKVLSPHPHAFHERELKILQLIAGLLSTSLVRAQLLTALQNSENKFRHLIDASYGAIVVAEKNVIIEANQAFCDLFGYTAEEIVGLSTFTLVTTKAVEQARKQIAKNYDRPYELTGLRKDGSTFALEAVGKTSEVNGRDLRITAARDISARKNTEDILRASEMKFRSVLHSVNDAIIAANKTGDIIAWNQAAERIFGYTEADVLGKPLTLVIPERFRAAHTAGMARVTQTGQTKLVGKTVELVGLRRSGEEFPIELSLATWQQLSEDHSETFFTSVIRDVTDKKNAESALRSTTKTLQTLIKSSPVGILVLGLDQKVTLWNPACEAMFGWSEAEVLGKTLPYVQPEQRASSDQVIENMHRTREKFEAQVARTRKDGSPIQIHIAAMPLLNENDQVYSHVAVVRDVSDQVKFTQQLQDKEVQLLKTNKALLEATKAKSEFLANMSHEIRTPLNGVLGMASLLLDTTLNLEQRDYTEAIRTSADTLLTIINDILDFSKVEAGKMDLEIIDFTIDDVVQDIEKSLNFTANTKGLALFKSRAPSLPEHFMGDPNRIRQVLLNLVANAIKFTAEGHVRIEIRENQNLTKGSQVLFEVTDTGVGISEEVLGRLFQAFTQADSSTTRKFGGTGLGLSISKHLVHLMGGEIGVRSTVGVGSTFWFSLPLLPGKAPTLEVAALNPKASLQRLRILIAEDISVNQIIAIKMFERMGHTAIAVANGSEVLDSLAKTPFDVVFMDCQMPEMDGYQATRLIRSSSSLACKKIPIIAMTANALKGDREKCLEAGMDDYITKPIRARDLDDVLQRTFKAKIAS